MTHVEKTVVFWDQPLRCVAMRQPVGLCTLRHGLRQVVSMFAYVKSRKHCLFREIEAAWLRAVGHDPANGDLTMPCILDQNNSCHARSPNRLLENRSSHNRRCFLVSALPVPALFFAVPDGSCLLRRYDIRHSIVAWAGSEDRRELCNPPFDCVVLRDSSPKGWKLCLECMSAE